MEDYRARFGHDSEGFWCAECAIDKETVDELANAGVKFVILSPWQAESINNKKLNGKPAPYDRAFILEGNEKTISTVQDKHGIETNNLSSATNVSLKKIMSVSENLKLRAGEATSTQVLTVMSAGTKVKILELGKEETIDGINSNWVKVEVISGRDRDGKDIKKKTTGWCYGGYLE